MSCLGYKGGIGTASRVVPDGFTVGVLALTNFGDDEELVVDGVPIGRLLPVDNDPSGRSRPKAAASWSSRPTRRSRTRSASGSRAAPASASLAPARPRVTAAVRSSVAFSTTHRGHRETFGPLVNRVEVASQRLNPLFAATVEATEEAVINSLFVADTVVGVDGHRSLGLPHDRVLDLLRSHGRLH